MMDQPGFWCACSDLGELPEAVKGNSSAFLESYCRIWCLHPIVVHGSGRDDL